MVLGCVGVFVIIGIRECIEVWNWRGGIRMWKGCGKGGLRGY